MFGLFGGLGPTEILVILLIVLLLFGAKRIPEVAQGLGKGLREFKKAAKDIQKDIDQAVDEEKKPDK
jgi:sec-independent protein translocase protein TatA